VCSDPIFEAWIDTVTPFTPPPHTHHLNLAGSTRISQVVLAAAGGVWTPVDATVFARVWQLVAHSVRFRSAV